MKHLETEQLKKYGQRKLNIEEVAQAVWHLDECEACFDAFQKLFPALSDPQREVSYADLTADDGEIFHLDYDEHLRPYVDFEADEVLRQIVESHLQNCSFCAVAVRELREFSDDLKWGGLEKKHRGAVISNQINDRVSLHLLNKNSQYLMFSAALILILGIGGWLIWRQTGTAITVAENQPSKVAPAVAADENSFDPAAVKPTTNLKVKNDQLPVAPRTNNSPIKNSEENIKSSDSLPPRAEPLLAVLPADFRVKFQNALRTQRIKLPEFIAELREKSRFRGDAENGRKIILSPNAQAARSTQPTFKWQDFSGGKNYTVTIYDQDFNQIAVSPSLRVPNWQANITLERGKIYRWQVKSENSGDSYAAQFKILDKSAIVRLEAIEKSAAHSPLALGIGYASEGLLTEAEEAFQKEITKNPPGKLAARLKKRL